MGIQGIYSQIGSGERIALSKFAAEHNERYARPLRIAIDYSIWDFQIQSGQGGRNAALRTLYYRLLRLFSLGIKPLFVFDGPKRPPFKRDKKIYGASRPNQLSIELFTLFNVPYHTAPGEAEAECALLQKAGVVDAVLSEDIDTLMFGATTTLRSWTSEGPRGSKTPTHVNVYTAENAGIDRDGMVLVALMSGGDYIPAGIPHCGIKIAWQAARAGFGKDLCQLSGNPKFSAGLIKWRTKLEHELHTNESGFFLVKHKALKIPDDFPDMAVLRYYTHPEVSSAERVLQLSEVNWNVLVDVPLLRKFVAEAFEWNGLSGARKLVRGLAPALLVHGF